MRSTMALTARLALLLCVTTASACATQERTRPAFPPAADISDAIAPKPQITVETVTSEQASEDYNAALEAWGDTGHDAGARLCRWFERAGMKLSFDCPKAVKPDASHAERPH